MRLRDIPERGLLLLLCAEILLIAALAVWKVPFSYPEGDIALNALSVLQTGHVQSTFVPGFYPYVMAHAYGWGGPAGFILSQLVFFAGLLLLMQYAIRLGTGHRRGALLAAMLLALDPDLAAAIPKAIDTLATALLLLGIVCLCLRTRLGSNTPGWRTVAALGCSWGLALAIRPNLALAVVPIAWGLRQARTRQWALRVAAAAMVAFAVMAAANTAAHDSFYLPRNGPYNFFAGANAFTRSALEHGYNAELSIPAALAGHWPPGIPPPTQPHAYYNALLNPTYTRLALGFVARHPLQWVWLGVLKLFTLLRPSLRNHAMLSASGVVETLTSLLAPLWLGLVLAARRWGRTQRAILVDRLLLLTVGAYVLPFLLTNADPRFRTPLDALVLTHAAILLVRRPRRAGAGSGLSASA